MTDTPAPLTADERAAMAAIYAAQRERAYRSLSPGARHAALGQLVTLSHEIPRLLAALEAAEQSREQGGGEG